MFSSKLMLEKWEKQQKCILIYNRSVFRLDCYKSYVNFCFRFPKGLAMFLLPFYVPLGIVVMLIRIFFAMQLYLVLSVIPKSWFIRRYVSHNWPNLSGFVVKDVSQVH